jgi:hypothetical protein
MLPHGLATNVWLLGGKPSFGKPFYAGVENRFANFLKNQEALLKLDYLVYIIYIIGNKETKRKTEENHRCFDVQPSSTWCENDFHLGTFGSAGLRTGRIQSN